MGLKKRATDDKGLSSLWHKPKKKVGATRKVRKGSARITQVWDGKKWVSGDTVPKKPATNQFLNTTGLQIGKFPILDESIAKRQKKSDLWTQGSVITDSAFSREFAPKELKKELGPTPEPKPKDPTYGTGMPSNYPGGHRGGGKVTDDFTNKTTSTTKTKSTAKKKSSEYERALRIVDRHASGKNSVQLAKAKLLIRRHNEA